MADSNNGNDDSTHSVVSWTVGVVIVAIIIITLLTITAVLAGPPTV